MNDVRKTELLEIGNELSFIFDRLNRTRIIEGKKEMLEDRTTEKNIRNAQDHIMGAIFEIAKITG